MRNHVLASDASDLLIEGAVAYIIMFIFLVYSECESVYAFYYLLDVHVLNVYNQILYIVFKSELPGSLLCQCLILQSEVMLGIVVVCVFWYL